ncbi:MAG TPA: acyltransferase [Chthoniobacteraceae bacterium]|nr:acyltransferase [Chthoniobacteraceae bacterium]
MDLKDRNNSFTFLRLVFSIAVVISHSYAIGGFGNDPLMSVTGGEVTLGFIAVLSFFIVSGFLITGSAVRHTLPRFLINRAARILPGFWTVQLITALVMAPLLILAKYPVVEGYFDSLIIGRNSALSYLGNNAFLHIRQYSILDLFKELPAGASVNGSLWSLGPEATCYLYLGLFTIVGGLRARVLAPLLFLFVYTVHTLVCLEPKSAEIVSRVFSKGGILLLHNNYYRSVYVAFVSGLLFYQYRHLLRWNWVGLTTSLLLLTGGCFCQRFALVWPLTLPYIVLYLAFRLPFERLDRCGDFSFGIYIYSFPIQQCLALAGLHHLGVIPFALASVTLALGAGVLSWRLIEKPSLDWVRSVQVRRTSPVVPVTASAPAEIV